MTIVYTKSASVPVQAAAVHAKGVGPPVSQRPSFGSAASAGSKSHVAGSGVPSTAEKNREQPGLMVNVTKITICLLIFTIVLLFGHFAKSAIYSIPGGFHRPLDWAFLCIYVTMAIVRAGLFYICCVAVASLYYMMLLLCLYGYSMAMVASDERRPRSGQSSGKTPAPSATPQLAKRPPEPRVPPKRTLRWYSSDDKTGKKKEGECDDQKQKHDPSRAEQPAPHSVMQTVTRIKVGFQYIRGRCAQLGRAPIMAPAVKIARFLGTPIQRTEQTDEDAAHVKQKATQVQTQKFTPSSTSAGKVQVNSAPYVNLNVKSESAPGAMARGGGAGVQATDERMSQGTATQSPQPELINESKPSEWVEGAQLLKTRKLNFNAMFEDPKSAFPKDTQHRIMSAMTTKSQQQQGSCHDVEEPARETSESGQLARQVTTDRQNEARSQKSSEEEFKPYVQIRAMFEPLLREKSPEREGDPATVGGKLQTESQPETTAEERQKAPEGQTQAVEDHPKTPQEDHQKAPEEPLQAAEDETSTPQKERQKAAEEPPQAAEGQPKAPQNYQQRAPENTSKAAKDEYSTPQEERQKVAHVPPQATKGQSETPQKEHQKAAEEPPQAAEGLPKAFEELLLRAPPKMSPGRSEASEEPVDAEGPK
ncbi:hypothetical protein MTO96_014966 [Rhipicephalus appendiculatus]